MRTNTQTKPCEFCGALVTKTGRQAGQRTYWTCGPSCSAKLRIARGVVATTWPENRFRGVRETRDCAVCGGPTTRYVTEANHDQPWHCSRECSAASRRGTKTLHPKGDLFPCTICGTPFYRFPKEVRRQRLYCSRACQYAGQSVVTTEKPCARCGKPMTLRPSEMVKQFCSWECKVAAKYKNALDRTHNGKPARLTHEGYVKVWAPEHPNASSGWVLEHRLLMEKQIGRLLTSEEEVDHINSDRADNRIENLQVLSRGAHRRKTGADARQRRMTMRERLAEYERRFGPLA